MTLSITLSAVAGQIGDPIIITGSQDNPVLSVISTLTHTAGVVTVTTSTSHKCLSGQTATISGTTDAGYHGAFVITITGDTTFTYELGGSLGAATGGTASCNQVFNIPHNKNVITFDGVIADIISGTSGSLLVSVPILATDGNVIVETFLDVVEEEDQRAISPDIFTVQYDDKKFPENKNEPEPFHKGSINDRVKTLGINPSASALYNRDFSYSKFIEVTDENSMVQNFLSLILTSPLERMWEPNIGSSIPQLPFKLIQDPDELEIEIFKEAERLVKEYEPRITLIRSNSFVSVDPDTNRIDVVFAILVPTGSIKEVGITLGYIQNEKF